MEKIKTLALLHVINILSLVFIVGNIILRLFFEGNHYGGLFLWSLLISALALFLKTKTRFFGGVLILWVALPIIRDVPLFQIGYLAFIGIFMLTLFYKNLEDPHYDRIEFEFRTGITIASFLLFFSLIMGGIRLFNHVAAGYLLIYLLSGVLLLRSLRYIEHNGDVKQLRKINLRAIGIVLILSIALSTEVFMRFYQQLRSLLWIGYNALVNFVLWVLYWPIYFMGSVLNYIITTFLQNPEGFPQEGGAGDVEGDMQNIHQNFESASLAESPLFRILLGIALLMVLFFILYKIYSRKATTRGVSETYTERKEVILPNRNRNLWQAIKNRLKPKSKEDKIRMYYQDFLESLKEKGVVLLSSDTTRDFQRKGEPYFVSEELSAFRDIYLQARYGEKSIDQATYKMAKNIHDKFMKKKE